MHRGAGSATPSSVQPTICNQDAVTNGRTTMICTSMADDTSERPSVLRRRVSSVDSTARQLTSAVLQEMINHSEFFSHKLTVPPLPSFSPSDVKIGRLLGHGHFGEVFELLHLSIDSQPKKVEMKETSFPSAPRNGSHPHFTSLTLTHGVYQKGLGNETEDIEKADPLSNEDDGEETSQQNHVGMSEEHHKNRLAERMATDLVLSDGSCRYAVKRLFQHVHVSLYDDAIVDLTSEAMFLSRLTSHPNIVTLHATAGTPGTSSFMLVLDRLQGNLHQKIQEWRLTQQRCRGKAPFGLWTRNRKGLEILRTDRLSAVHDIARALRHLHRNRVLYRDIKPENIGVDTKGSMRLFDFGLAKELKKRDLVDVPDGYLATGVTGSRRYMAPEVCQSLPYGFSADVYSFGILLWEIMQLQTPFCGFDACKHNELVVVLKQRPTVPKSWPPFLRRMLLRCWSHSPLDRVSMDQVCESLQEQLDACAAACGYDSACGIPSRTSSLSPRKLSL